MKKTKAKIDWIMAEDEEKWQMGEDTPSPAADRPFYRREAWLSGLIAIVLPLLLFGAWFAQRPGASAPPSSDPPGRVVQGSQAVTQSVPVREVAPFGTTSEMKKIERLGDRMMVQMITHHRQEGVMLAYRETRFYARGAYESAHEWLQVSPDPALLGEKKTLKVANFTILYRAADTDAVYQAVPQLEKLYTTLRQDIGLPALAAGVAYTIEISAGDRLGGNFYDYSRRKLAIYSPTLLSAPIQIAPATLIEQATVYPLAQLLMHELINRHDTRWQYTFSQWWPIENVLPLWELWHAHGSIAVSRLSIIPWLYHNSQNASNRRPLPYDYAQLCHLYQIWRLLPADLDIPLICEQAERNVQPLNGYSALGTTWPPLSGAPGRSMVLTHSADANNITLESILEYIVATYGRDKLPQLLIAMGEHSTTDTLIPALFGVSRSDFETAWQAYLAQHT